MTAFPRRHVRRRHLSTREKIAGSSWSWVFPPDLPSVSWRRTFGAKTCGTVRLVHKSGTRTRSDSMEAQTMSVLKECYDTSLVKTYVIIEHRHCGNIKSFAHWAVRQDRLVFQRSSITITLWWRSPPQHPNGVQTYFKTERRDNRMPCDRLWTSQCH